MRARWLGIAVALLAPVSFAACGVRRVDACDDRRTAEATCVNLQVEGALGELDGFSLLLSGDWVGHSEPSAQNPFQLPAAVAVALPPTFRGSVRMELTALRNRQAMGQGVAVAKDLMPGEHREVPITLEPVLPKP
jgi:hypothetical protein